MVASGVSTSWRTLHADSLGWPAASNHLHLPLKVSLDWRETGTRALTGQSQLGTLRHLLRVELQRASVLQIFPLEQLSDLRLPTSLCLANTASATSILHLDLLPR